MKISSNHVFWALQLNYETRVLRIIDKIHEKIDELNKIYTYFQYKILAMLNFTIFFQKG